ncbi:hypothetical protein LSCM4_07073 [Leishmania orientalis]|uniref:Uncharacterized protein n=1 Tax=Leishmania orientalis TaxID=2249476 RepID=A0A836GG28_9TRYP|nr:hypothetical protein LSCM4_07073 [Leishmania orientalis]
MRVSLTLNRGGGGRIYIGGFARGGPFGAPGAMHPVATRAPGAVMPPSSGRCDKGTTCGKSPLQLRAIFDYGRDVTACAPDGAFCSWSIQSALQAAYPPVPLVTAFYSHRGSLLSPRLFYGGNLLPAPPSLCTNCSGVPQGGTAAGLAKSTHVEALDAGGGASDAALLLLLCDVATLPWAAGSRLTLALHNAAVYSDDELARRGPLEASGSKGDRREVNSLSIAAPVEARVDVGAVEQPRFTPIATAHSSLAHPDAKRVSQDRADSFSSAVIAADGHCGKEAWKPFSDYSMAQACAETSVLALRSFAVAALGQRVPLVVLAAEKACGAGVTFPSLNDECATPRTSTVYAQKRPDSPAWLPPRTAVHGVPMEVYAERTPLVLTRGTAALQQALGQALNRIAVVPAGRKRHNAAPLSASFHSPPSPLASGGLRRSLPPLAHLIWNGQCWVEEADVQVAEMEERLLGTLAGGRDGHATASIAGAIRSAQNRNTITCRTRCTPGATRGDGDAGRLAGLRLGWNAQSSSYPRLWLPSVWPQGGSRGGVSTPLFRHDSGADPETEAVLGRPGWAATSPPSKRRLASNPYEAWKRVSGDAGVAEAALEAPATAPTALEGDSQTPGALRCSQWVLRLRKTWLVTSPDVRSSILASAGAEAQANLGDADAKSAASMPAADRWASGHLRAPSSSSYAPVPLRYPNYDLLTGLPLDLRDYDAAARKALGTARGSRTSSRSSPTLRPPKLPRWPSETTQPPPARDGGVLQTQAAGPAHEGGPFFFAALSQQVGWIRLCPISSPHTLHVDSSSSSTPVASPATGPVSWRLPDALRSCYTLPSTIADVPQRCLCSGTAADGQAAAPSAAAASSTATELGLPVSPQPPVASVSVPRQEWYTGFFLHDAPHWWRHRVSECVHHRWAAESISKGTLTTSVRPRHELSGERVATWEEVTQMLSFLQEECGVPPPPVSPSSAAAAAACPRQGGPEPRSDSPPPLQLTPKMSTLPPQLCVLQLAPVAPKLRRAHRLIRCDGEGELENSSMSTSTTQALSLELQWSIVADTATVTVNTFFSLQDVADHAGAAGSAAAALPLAPSAERAALFYLEVKTALEILRRVTHAAGAWEDAVDDAEGPSPPPSSSLPAWWEHLSAFYDANTFVATETAPSAAILTTGVDHEVGGGGDGDLEKTHSGADAHETLTSALCHPTVTEVVRACLRLMLQCSEPSKHRYVSDCPITLGRGDTENKSASPEALAVWSRRDYDALLRTAGPAATTSSTPYLRSEDAEGDGDNFGEHDEAEWRGTEELVPYQRADGAAHTENGSDSSRAVSTGTQGRHSASISSGAVAPPMQDQATNMERGSPSSAQVTQRSPSASSCLPYGVEVREYDEDGMRREKPDNPGGRTACMKGPKPLSTEPEDRLVVDRRAPLGRRYRLSEAFQSQQAPGGFEAVAAADVALNPFASNTTAGGESQQAATRGTTCGDAILAARKEAMRNSGDAGASVIPTAPSQLNSAGALVQDERSLYSGLLEDCTSSASTPYQSDVIGALMAEEHDRFEREWEPWLRYLPLPATPQDGTLPHTAPPTTPQRRVRSVFHFLKSSAASEYCTDCPCKTKTSAEDNAAKSVVDMAAPSAAAALTDGSVIVQDLGLCVLHVRLTELYVNAANLIFCEAHGTRT